MAEFRNINAFSVDKQEEGLITVASGPVIIEDDRVLLVQHGEEKLWKFPGGACYDHESFQATATREAKEELDIDVEIQSAPYILSFTKEKEGKSVIVVLIHYLAKRLNDTIKLGHQIDKFEWFDVNRLPTDVHVNVRPVVNHFSQAASKQPSIYSQPHE